VLSYVLWPFVITAGTGATYLGLESGYPLPAVFFAAGAGMLARVLVAEQWIPRRPDWNALADRQSINDLGQALVANPLGERVGELVFLTLAASAAGGLTAEHHDHYEKTHAEHHWWDWYAPYLNARQNGSSPAEAAVAADRYMEEVHHVPPR